MRWVLCLLLAATLNEPCDLKHVEDALWCEACAAYLEPETTLDKKFCKKCNEGKKKSERVEPKTKRVCRKTWYECSEHPDQRAWSKSKKCPTCQKPMAAKTDRADLVFQCSGCTKTSDKEGPCPLVDCKNQNLSFKPACKKSGSHPHTKEK